jgi:hypothetical protein
VRIRLATWTSVVALSVSAGMVTAVPASKGTDVVLTGSTSPLTSLDPVELESAMDAVHRAGTPGAFAEVRAAGQVWRGASGLADVDTGRSVRPGNGTVWGAQTVSLTRADGKRQMSVAMNLARWNEVDSSGKPRSHPIDDALSAFSRQARCGDEEKDG